MKNANNRKGRPKKKESEKLTKKVTVVLSENEYDFLVKIANYNNLSKSAYIRSLLNVIKKIQN